MTHRQKRLFMLLFNIVMILVDNFVRRNMITVHKNKLCGYLEEIHEIANKEGFY